VSASTVGQHANQPIAEQFVPDGILIFSAITDVRALSDLNLYRPPFAWST
jgi:hypothetical protein